MQTDAPDTRALSAEISALLGAPSGGAGAPSLRELEDTLTTGYARALALEAERERIERGLAGATGLEQADLSRRLERVKVELTDLRRLLAPLRTRPQGSRSGRRRPDRTP
jgi:hypothetical protein